MKHIRFGFGRREKGHLMKYRAHRLIIPSSAGFVSARRKDAFRRTLRYKRPEFVGVICEICGLSRVM